MKWIFVNGREYRSVDEMPPEVRRIYEARARGEDSARYAARYAARDADSDPPEAGGEEGGTTVVEIDRTEIRPAPGTGVEEQSETRIVIDGREYSHPGELPPRARELYEFMMGRMREGDAPGAPGPERVEGPGLPGPEVDTRGPGVDRLTIAAVVLAVLFVISLLT